MKVSGKIDGGCCRSESGSGESESGRNDLESEIDEIGLGSRIVIGAGSGGIGVR